MREEKLTKLWKQYRIFLVGGVVALVVGVAGFQWWKGYATDQRMDAGRQFDSASEQIRSGNIEAAQAAFEALAVKADAGYALIASLRSAQLQIDNGNLPAARLAFQAIATDQSIEELYRNIAKLRSVMTGMQMGVEAATLQTELTPLTADTSHWRFLARELSALIDLDSGDTASARATLDALANDAIAPAGVRERATAIVSTLRSSGS